MEKKKVNRKLMANFTLPSGEKKQKKKQNRMHSKDILLQIVHTN